MTAASHLLPPHLQEFLTRHHVAVEFVAPGVPMPTVRAAAAAIGAFEDQILKTVLFRNKLGAHVVAIASGQRRIDRDLLAAASGVTGLRVAAPDDVLAVTGFPAGGVAPLGLPPGLIVVVDNAVAALPYGYGGGGREDLLLRVSPADIIRLNRALVATIVTDPAAH